MNTLRVDYKNGEGEIHLDQRFKESEAILRADVLKDWIYDLQNEYDKALIELRKGGSHDKRAANPKAP